MNPTPAPTPQQIEELAREAGIEFVPMTIGGTRYDYRNVSLNDNIGGDEAGCVERFATLLLERFGQAPAAQQEPIGIVGPMLGTSGFTMVCFRADDVPVGTKLYTHPAPAEVREPLTFEQWEVQFMLENGRPPVSADAWNYSHGITGGK